MARHFLQLYALIVVTLAGVSWGQEQLWQAYGRADPAEIAAANPSQAALLSVLQAQLRSMPAEHWTQFVQQTARDSGVDLELFESADIAGTATIATLARGELAFMHAADGESWLLKQVAQDRILAFRYSLAEPQRGALDWLLTFIFYAAIALVIMAWLWPLRRDLRMLEHATATFGDRNWVFNASIGRRSPVSSLAQAFRSMATRIDGLIRSHQDMSNALSHEIKTPLSRMRFEVEMARTATDPQQVAAHLNHIDTDIAELDSFVKATLDYAILERAEVALNLAPHDLTAILPAIVQSVTRSSRTSLQLTCEVDSQASQVICDAHLLETVIRNLLYNALRYARSRIHVSCAVSAGRYRLCVDDDGPGIPEADRARVFESFVRLDQVTQDKAGFGLGLAIVRRVMEWHRGSAEAARSDLGGARFCIEWPQPKADG